MAIDNNTTAIKYQTSVLETIAVQSIVEIETNKKGHQNTDIYKSNKAIKNQQEIIDAAKEEITKIKKQNQPVIDKLRKDIDRNNLIISNLNETD